MIFRSLWVVFFARPGKKTTHNKDKVPCCRRLKRCERKSYLCVILRTAGRKITYNRSASRSSVGSRPARGKPMSAYNDLGIKPIINAAATLTRLGGSRMPPPVVAAMAAGAQSFVDLLELQARVGARIAELTHNQACYVASGAAAGVALATAACITGADPVAIAGFPQLDGRKNEVIVHRSQRNGYDYAIRQTGARLIEIGTLEATTRAELEAAISPQTACVVYFAGEHFARGA